MAKVAAALAATPPANNNLALWESLFHTDPSHTKPFQKTGGFKGTAIKPYWCMMRATEEFGPVGKGWGWDEIEHKTYCHTDGRALWFSKIVVWYVLDGMKYETGPQWGATELVAKRKDGSEFLDEEAAKKSVTDGLTKCLSYLGLAGDVHMGLFDDSKYVEKQKGREARETAALVTAPDDVVAWRDRVVSVAKGTDNSESLKLLWAAEKGKFAEYGKSDDQPTKATALYVKSQVERRAADLRAAADQATQAEDNGPAHAYDPDTGEMREGAE